MINRVKLSNQVFSCTQVSNLPARSHSLNIEEYFDEDEIRSLATSSSEALSEETRKRQRHILPMLEKDIADLIQDTNSMQRVFLAIKGDPSPTLSKVLLYLSSFEDQALKAKKIQRNLSNHEALMAQDSSNKQEAKELMRLIDDLKNSSSRADPEFSQLEIKRAKLEKELESVKAAIDRRKFTLAQIPDVVKQKKEELLA